ncbi:hypothetical protein HK098_003086 [Nowakowskiella sp. JEL0407]|nr:hypothetical protein HK098_003086 [Nowakowskiella sp. JEL0407]
MVKLLWETEVLQRYGGNANFRVDLTGKLILEPEQVYSILVDLTESVTPAEIFKIPDSSLPAKINDCVVKIMEYLATLDTSPTVTTSRFKFAVRKIVKDSALLILKLRKSDLKYTPYLPEAGDVFDEKRMSRINEGEKVEFVRGLGWEKKREEENIAFDAGSGYRYNATACPETCVSSGDSRLNGTGYPRYIQKDCADALTLDVSSVGSGAPSGDSSSNDTLKIGLIAGIAGLLVLIIIGSIFGVYIYRKRKNATRNNLYPVSAPPLSPAQPILPNTPIQLAGYSIVPSLNVATFEHASEQSLLDEVEAIRDKIHRLASSVTSANPTALIYPSTLRIPNGEEAPANIAYLKGIISISIYHSIFKYFDEDYHNSIAKLLWSNRILNRYVNNPNFRIDPSMTMILEPERIYEVLLDLTEVSSPPDIFKIPDPNLKERVNDCVNKIMRYLTPLETDLNTGSMYKFAVTKIVKESVTTVLKLKRSDCRYTAYIPKRGDMFDEQRMSRINSGEKVLFVWGVGWEKITEESESIVKVLAQVWVK